MSLVNFNNVDKVAGKYKLAKSVIEEKSIQIQKKIKEETKKETEEVEAAIKKLNKKLEDLMNREDIKILENEIVNSEKEMKNALNYAFNLFNKIKKIIYEKDNLSPNEKKEYEKKLADKIIERFLSKEEMIMFKNMIRYGNIMIIPSGNMNMIGY